GYFKKVDVVGAFEQGGKNAVLAVPKLGHRSQSGSLTKPSGFAAWLEAVLEALATEGPWPVKPELGRLVLAAHSGGGFQAVTLAEHLPEVDRDLRGVWMFDALYYSPSLWSDLLRARSDVEARFAYTPHTYAKGKGDMKKNHQALAKALPRADVGAAGVSHNRVP